MKNYNERIIGWVRKTGEFNGNKYDNIVLIVVAYEKGIPVNCDAKNYKFKTADCYDVLGFDYEPVQLDQLYGLFISKPYFNKYGQLIGVDYEQ